MVARLFVRSFIHKYQLDDVHAFIDIMLHKYNINAVLLLMARRDVYGAPRSRSLTCVRPSCPHYIKALGINGVQPFQHISICEILNINWRHLHWYLFIVLFLRLYKSCCLIHTNNHVTPSYFTDPGGMYYDGENGSKRGMSFPNGK